MGRGEPPAPDEGEAMLLDRAALSRVLAHVAEAVVACDGTGRITFASQGLKELLGYDPEIIVGRNIAEFLHPDELEDALESLVRWADRPGVPRGEAYQVRAADGEWVTMRYDALTGPPAQPLGDLVLTLRPAGAVDERRAEVSQRLLGEERIVRLASIFAEVDADGFAEGLDQAMLELSGLEWVTRLSVWRVDGHRVHVEAQWSASATAPSGKLPPVMRIDSSWVVRRVSNLQEVHITSVAHLPDDCAEEREILRSWGVKGLLAVPMVRAGAFFGFVLAESTFADAPFDATHLTALRSAASIMAGAFSRYDAEVELARRARSDVLTGLPNRWAFQDTLRLAIEDVRRRLSPGVGVVLIDLDRFKLVNDALGHSAGDRLLGEVAGRLSGAASEGTTIARLGGDELMLLHHRVSSLDDAVARTRDMLDVLAPPFVVEGQPVSLTASAGVVHTALRDGGLVADPEELLRRADLAMYRAKARGGDQVEVDDEALRVTVSQRLRREAELREAIEGEGLLAYVQGEWDLRTGAIIGAEALARWDHPTEGILAAGSFIPMAEECGMVVPLGERVLQTTCDALAAWQASGVPKDFVMRVNVSAMQLHRGRLVDQVRSILAETGLPPASLCLELTESTLLADPERSIAVLDELRSLGLGLALDDFGTGFSSMLYIKRLPFTSLKIDQSFVAGLPDDDRDRAIVSSVVELAGRLGVTVTAEGVELPQQQAALLELGCDRGQGFLLSKPEPLDDFALRLDLAASSTP